MNQEDKAWDKVEVEYIMNSIANGESYNNLSEIMGRSAIQIKNKLLEECNKRIKNGDGLEAYYCNEYNITSEELRQAAKI